MTLLLIYLHVYLTPPRFSRLRSAHETDVKELEAELKSLRERLQVSREELEKAEEKTILVSVEAKQKTSELEQIKKVYF